MTDLYLARVDAFTRNNCFGRSITSWNYIIYAHHELEKKSIRRKQLWYIYGGAKQITHSVKFCDCNIIPNVLTAFWISQMMLFTFYGKSTAYQKMSVCFILWLAKLFWEALSVSTQQWTSFVFFLFHLYSPMLILTT